MFVCSNGNMHTHTHTHTQTIYIQKTLFTQQELKSSCLWACFQNTLSPLSVVSTKQGNFIISQHENSAFNAQGSFLSTPLFPLHSSLIRHKSQVLNWINFRGREVSTTQNRLSSLFFFKLLDMLLLNISTTYYARNNCRIKLVFLMSMTCHTKVLGFRRFFQKWWNCKINGLNVLELEVLCYFKIVVFKFSYYVFFGCQFNFF